MQMEIDRLTETVSRLRERIAEHAGKLHSEEATRKLCQQVIATVRKALSFDWQERADRVALAEMNRFRGEREDLEKRGVEGRAAELSQARIEAESLNQTLAELDREVEQIPADARIEPEKAAAQLKAARAIFAEKTDILNSAQTNEQTSSFASSSVTTFEPN